MSPLRSPLNANTFVLIGLMGVGKSSVGRRLASRLGLPFADADDEIVKAAGCSIEDIFELYGEEEFRDGERRVISRLLGEGPMVLATGGGAFIDPITRAEVLEHAVSVWLRADLDVLVERTGRRGGRPLLKKGDPRDILSRLMAERDPVYAEADITLDSLEESSDATADSLMALLASQLGTETD